MFGEVQNAPSAIYWEPQYSIPVRVCEFGAVGDKVHDDTVNIQAAIDWGIARVSPPSTGLFLLTPGSNYLVTAPLYLDPPGNLRVNYANPTNFSFSLTLDGGQGQGNSAGAATIWTTFPAANIPVGNVPNFQCGLWVGPGQGMVVRNVNIRGPQNFRSASTAVCRSAVSASASPPAMAVPRAP